MLEAKLADPTQDREAVLKEKRSIQAHMELSARIMRADPIRRLEADRLDKEAQAVLDSEAFDFGPLEEIDTGEVLQHTEQDVDEGFGPELEVMEIQGPEKPWNHHRSVIASKEEEIDWEVRPRAFRPVHRPELSTVYIENKKARAALDYAASVKPRCVPVEQIIQVPRPQEPTLKRVAVQVSTQEPRDENRIVQNSSAKPIASLSLRETERAMELVQRQINITRQQIQVSELQRQLRIPAPEIVAIPAPTPEEPVPKLPNVQQVEKPAIAWFSDDAVDFRAENTIPPIRANDERLRINGESWNRQLRVYDAMDRAKAQGVDVRGQEDSWSRSSKDPRKDKSRRCQHSRIMLNLGIAEPSHPPRRRIIKRRDGTLIALTSATRCRDTPVRARRYALEIEKNPSMRKIRQREYPYVLTLNAPSREPLILKIPYAYSKVIGENK